MEIRSSINESLFNQQETELFEKDIQLFLSYESFFENRLVAYLNPKQRSFKDRLLQYCSQKNGGAFSKNLTMYFCVHHNLSDIRGNDCTNLKIADGMADKLLESCKGTDYYDFALCTKASVLEKVALELTSEKVLQKLRIFVKFPPEAEALLINVGYLQGNNKKGYCWLKTVKDFHKEFLKYASRVSKTTAYGHWLSYQASVFNCKFGESNKYDYNLLKLGAQQGSKRCIEELAAFYMDNPNGYSFCVRDYAIDFETVRAIYMEKPSVFALCRLLDMWIHGIGGPKIEANKIVQEFYDYVNRACFEILPTEYAALLSLGIAELKILLHVYKESHLSKEDLLKNKDLMDCKSDGFKNIEERAIYQEVESRYLVEAYYLLAMAYEILDEQAKVQQYLEKIIKLQEEDKDISWTVLTTQKALRYANYTLGKIAYEKEAFDNALKYFQKAKHYESSEADDFIQDIKMRHKELSTHKQLQNIVSRVEIERKKDEEQEALRLKNQARLLDLRTQRKAPELLVSQWVYNALKEESETKRAKEEARLKIQAQERKEELKKLKPRLEVSEEEAIIEEKPKMLDPRLFYTCYVNPSHLETFRTVMAYKDHFEEEVVGYIPNLNNNNNSNEIIYEGNSGLSALKLDVVLSMIEAIGGERRRKKGKSQGSHIVMEIPRIDLNKKGVISKKENALEIEGEQHQAQTFPYQANNVQKVYIKQLAQKLEQLKYSLSNVKDIREQISKE